MGPVSRDPPVGGVVRGDPTDVEVASVERTSTEDRRRFGGRFRELF
jgi:hypothetical protein